MAGARPLIDEMAKINEHGRIIAAAAKAALEPIGLKRKGQSRVWLSDQRFWVISVEFQPSGWSKGSYLNVGIKWLWHPGPGLDWSDRPVDFVPFESAEQFAPLMKGMAAHAAQEVQAWRVRFDTFAEICGYLIANAKRDGWPVYHAAVAAGLAGDQETSRRFFQQMEDWQTYGYDWQLRLKSDSAALATLSFESEKFRAKVLNIIEGTRALMKMPSDPTCLEMIDFQAAR
ncbi:MAG: hypothetical protein K2Y71_26100 [Xanthobacteraceae bacterium]|nr:hypothetical protein [Xanthobacteraceae bacterium]